METWQILGAVMIYLGVGAVVIGAVAVCMDTQPEDILFTIFAWPVLCIIWAGIFLIRLGMKIGRRLR